MPYSLATNRYGLFLDTDVPAESPDKLIKELRTRLSSTIRAKPFGQIHNSLLSTARRQGLNPSIEKSAKLDGNIHEVVASFDEQQPSNQIFVGLLPCSKLKVQMEEVEWIITARASVAVADIPRKDHLSHMASIWLTYEGVPSPDSARPEESNAQQFYAATEEMNNGVMPLFRSAFEKYTPVSASPENIDRVRICVADVESRSFAELLDTLSSHPRPISEVKDPDPLKGLDEFRAYAYGIGKLKVTDATVTVEEAEPGVKAVICRRDDHSHAGASAVAIVGFAHRKGLSVALSRSGKTEQYIRTMSAARKVSTKLAEQEIAAHNRRFQSLRP